MADADYNLYIPNSRLIAEAYFEQGSVFNVSCHIIRLYDKNKLRSRAEPRKPLHNKTETCYRRLDWKPLPQAWFLTK